MKSLSKKLIIFSVILTAFSCSMQENEVEPIEYNPVNTEFEVMFPEQDSLNNSNKKKVRLKYFTDPTETDKNLGQDI
ncbi:hypothetical protein [Flammeovirga agarivorans]|uniref:Uncharacterized protein n=1 Tax=Flammeovirga agarivorans TaxID=2726742 RepID=A0A7X8XY11_9BACT|nr:hypothetical protein [Flammeovirga agarivorans]NLR93590.1 hypothetical protein [Flammeovirga agarivorans]